MSSPRNPFARAIEEFILEKQNEGDKTNVFYKEVLSKVNIGSLSRDAPEENQRGAQELAAYVDGLQQRNRTDSVGRRVTERLGPVISGFNQYAGACDVLVQAGPAAAMLLYGGVRIILQLVEKIQECYATVVEILEDINFKIQCFQLIATSYATPLVQDQLVESYKAIIEFWLKASQLFSSRSLRALFSRNGNSQLSREWQKQRTKLETCCARVEKAANAVAGHIQNQQYMQNEAKLRKEKMQNVVSWIKAGEEDRALDSREIIREKAAARHGKSGGWLLADPLFQAWLNADESRVIWLSGAPGTGKSVLASYVLQHLGTQEIHGKPLKTASYFFFFNDPARKKPITALRSIAVQLLATCLSVPDAVQRIYDEDASNHVGKLEDTTTAIRIIEALLKQMSRIHIVIDGLDECQNRKELLSTLKQLSSARPHGIVKWLFTSRPEKDIEASLWSPATYHIKASIDDMQDDVRAFMSEMLRGELGYDCGHCVDEWVSKSEGNFLWASTTLRIMRGEGLTCEAEVEEELAKFPAGLQGCYERSLLHLIESRTKTEIELAQKVFTLVAGAVQPLHLSEVEHALIALRNSRHSSRVADYDEKWKPRPGVVEDLCSALITFERPETMPESDPLLKFMHKSVQDFFVQDEEDLKVSEDVKPFFTSDEAANLLLGEACLRYLSFIRYEKPQAVQTLLAEREHAFLPHAATFWHHYLNYGSYEPDRQQVERVFQFIRSPCFWNCVAVQVHTVPHQFARLYEGRRSTFKLQASGDGSFENPDRVFYASPLPLWLDDQSCRPEDRRMLANFHAFIVQWHPVLNSSPAVVGQCVMNQDWNMSFPKRKRWTSDRVIAWHVPHEVESNESSAATTRVSIVDVRHEPTANKIIVTSVRESVGHNNTRAMTFDRSDMNSRSQVPDIDPRSAVGPSEGALRLHKEAQLLTDTSGPLNISLNTRNLVIEVHHAGAPSSSQKHFPSSNQYLGPWKVQNHSSSSYLADPSIIATAFCVSDHSFAEGLNRSQSRYDSDLDSDEEASESSGDEDSNDGESAYDSREDSGVDAGTASYKSSSKCIIVASSDKPAIYSFWTSNSALEEVTCAISPNRKLVIWSQNVSEASIIDLTAKNRTPIKIYLPEPTQLTSKFNAQATRKEFHFSEQGDRVYYMVYTATRSKLGIEQSLSMIPLTLSWGNTGPSLDRAGQASTITHNSAGTLQTPPIVTAWTPTYSYVALPQLACDPKVVRLRLSNPYDTQETYFETLRDPIYFPASTLDRNPKLYIFDSDESKQKLVLTLDSQSTPGGEATLHSPMIMQWTLDGKAGWRAWDAATDGDSEQYKNDLRVWDRLRGTFVDANQRFNVPIRSGLDWRKKAFVSCG